MSGGRRNPVPPSRHPAEARTIKAVRRGGKHPHSYLVGRPDAETVLFPALSAGPALAPDEAPESSTTGAEERRFYTRPFDAIRLLSADAVDGRPSRRRTVISRLVLLAILSCQAIVTLRLHNTAYQDEAQYLYAGHMQIARWLRGTALQGTYSSYFAGSPLLYPVLAAAVSAAGGLAAARALSLAEMLVVTALLYSLTRQLFNERVGLCAAAVFAVTEPAVLLGRLATVDASSLCLLAVAAWLVVRTAPWDSRAYLLAAPVAALAVATSYSAIFFLPTLAVLAGLAAYPHRGHGALARVPVLGALSFLLAAGAGAIAGQQYLTAVKTTIAAHGTASALQILADCGRWGGLSISVAIIGAVGYGWHATTEPGEDIALAGDRRRRVALGTCLTGTALIVPALQMYLHSEVWLDTHVGFGLFFAAPVAGVGLVRLVGDHFRRPQIGILIWAVALTLGLGQASQIFGGWPESAQLVTQLSHYLQPGAHYLVEDDDVPIYYLLGRTDAQPSQFTSTYFISFPSAGGHALTGTAGYLAAIKAGYFQVIAYDSTFTPGLDKALAAALEASPRYRLAAAFIESAAHSRTTCYIWVRT